MSHELSDVRALAPCSVCVPVQSTTSSIELNIRLIKIAMAKLEGSKTVVVGGKSDVKQRYCGVIGGQSTDFSTIDGEIKVSTFRSYKGTVLL